MKITFAFQKIMKCKEKMDNMVIHNCMNNVIGAEIASIILFNEEKNK
jgi:hypothetical protein